MSDRTTALKCDRHGVGYATFVCQHLVGGVGRGFFFAADDSDPQPDAWCYECDRLMLSLEGWNDESEKAAGITLLCSGCYDEVRTRNAVLRPSLEVDGWQIASRRDVKATEAGIAFPSADVVARVRIGGRVKVPFLIALDGRGEAVVQCERLWLRVTRKTVDALIGVLESTPTSSGRLTRGTLIDIPRSSVLEILEG